MSDSDLHVTGTLIWYYYICHREVWLMAHNILPDQDNANIDLGRFIGENTYQRDKKEIAIGHIKVDVLRKDKGKLVVGEVKKTSKYEKSAMMQLGLYLLEMKEKGVEASGELLFPKEKKKVKIELTEEMIAEIDKARRDILRIIYKGMPPPPEKIKFCRNCAYSEFCWS